MNYDFSYINRTYGVSAKRGLPVIAYGQPGKIVGVEGPYLLIKLDKSKHSNPYHPTDGIIYGKDASAPNSNATPKGAAGLDGWGA